MLSMFDSEEQQVAVAAGIIVQDSSILLCQRSINHRYGLKWEFPGGKVYPGETLEECLIRELEEELSITPTSFTTLRTLQASYSDGGKFLLTFFLVSAFDGEIRNNVFDSIAWVTMDDIHSYDILEGSKPILTYLQDHISAL